MALWLIVIIVAYFFYSLSSLGDKLVLSHAQKPKVYLLYVGMLSLLVLLFIPFTGFALPSLGGLFWIMCTSIVFMVGLYALYSATERFEVSRVIPLIGALQPIMVLGLSWVFFRELIAPHHLAAFVILFLASIVISFEKNPHVTKSLLKISVLAAFLAALNFVVSKMVFLREPFLQGVIWVGLFNFGFSLLLFFDSRVRKEIFVHKSHFKKKTLFLVVGTQAAGGLAGLLQNFSISLAPASSLSLLNALRGVQYVFLFILSLIFSVLLPKILKEEISKKAVIQKLVAILMIVGGLVILVA